MAQQLLPLYLRNTQIEANGTGTNIAPGKTTGHGLGLGPGSALGQGLGSMASGPGLGGSRTRTKDVDIDTVVPHSYLAGAPPLGTPIPYYNSAHPYSATNRRIFYSHCILPLLRLSLNTPSSQH